MFFGVFFKSFFIILPPQIRKIRVIVDYFLLKSKSQSSVIYQGRIYNVVFLPSGTAEQIRPQSRSIDFDSRGGEDLYDRNLTTTKN